LFKPKAKGLLFPPQKAALRRFDRNGTTKYRGSKDGTTNQRRNKRTRKITLP
jgi:hypothetical protein